MVLLEATFFKRKEIEMENHNNGVHDPTIIREGDTYYLVSTDTTNPPTAGVPIRKSTNLIDWTFDRVALDGVPKEAQEWSQAQGLWAPEIIRVQETYRMYYSASTFGSTTSMIGLATAPHPLGPWEDQGEVVKTNAMIATHNAIDANICYDREGGMWMVYGSFFGGIYLVALDPETGKPSEASYGECIAIRPQSVEGAIEGPFIYYHPETDMYYLFVSFDSLNDTYNIRVARAKEITGPYVDMNGVALTNQAVSPNQVGTKLLGSYQWENETPHYGPGHNSIFTDEDGSLYVVHHVRRVPHTADFFVQVRPLFWSSDGWPVIGGMPYDGQTQITIADEQWLGEWSFVKFNEDSALVHSYNETVLDEEFFKRGVCYRNQAGDTLFTGRTKENHAILGKRK